MIDRRLRVLHVIASLSPVRGGTTSSVLQMLEALADQGIDCDVATSDDDGPGRRLAPDAPERNLPGRHYFRKTCDLYTFTLGLGPWLRANISRYDIVHIHGLFSYVNGLAGRIARQAGVPYILTPHGMANRYGMRNKQHLKQVSFPLVERPLLESAATIHITSRSEERHLSELGILTSVDRIPLAVTPVVNGVADEFFLRYPDLRGKPLAVFVGRIHPVKNIESMVEALSYAHNRLADLRLIICGDGPESYVTDLHRLAVSLGVADRIVWAGFLSGQKKAHVLAAANVFVLPSLSESFGLAAVEAVSSGLPCVLGRDVGIADDLAQAGLSICVAPTGRAVANGIAQAISLKQNDASFTVRALTFVEKHFTSEAMGRRLAIVYSRCVVSDDLERAE